MQYSSFRKRLISGALVLLLVAAAPASVLASRHPAIGTHHLRAGAPQPAFIFGRKGGNIRPFTATINTNGQLTVTGMSQSPTANRFLGPQVAPGLLKLAEATQFFAAAPSIQCGTTLMPDTATIFITVTTTSGTKTVSMHGGCNTGFEQLWSVLAAIAGAV
ncbi:MAG: hypothetical protein NVS2B16_15720 [Chloroflexota bacterium]